MHSSTEYVFGNIVNYFAFLEKNLKKKVQLGAVGKMNSDCAFLTNDEMRLYQPMTSSYFAIEPPQLDDYLKWTQNKEETFYEMFISTNVLAMSLYKNEKYTFLEKTWAIFFW